MVWKRRQHGPAVLCAGVAIDKMDDSDKRRRAMQFLVHMVVTWPPDGDPDELQRRVAGEQQRGLELAEEGTIVRLWRVPGQWANWGIWEAPDATAIHDAVTSLPMWPYLQVEVHPLAQHPNDPALTLGRDSQQP